MSREEACNFSYNADTKCKVEVLKRTLANHRQILGQTRGMKPGEYSGVKSAPVFSIEFEDFGLCLLHLGMAITR
jgi:hypothetical protein